MFGIDPFFLIVVLFVIAVLLIASVVFWFLYRLKKQVKGHKEVVKKANAQAEKILNEARLKSREILQNAENNASQYLSRKRVEIDSFHDEFARQLHSLNEGAKKNFSESVEKVGKISGDIPEELKRRIEDSIENSTTSLAKELDLIRNNLEKETEVLSGKIKAINDPVKWFDDLNQEVKNNFSESAERINRSADEMLKEAAKHIEISAGESSVAMNKFTLLAREQMDREIRSTAKELASFKKSIGEELAGAIKGELEKVRLDLVNYRKESLNLVDQHIINLVEETAQITLNTKLSGDDHRIVVHNALKEAKERGVFKDKSI